MPAASAKSISRAVLPTPENRILAGRDAGGQRAAQLAFRDHVGAGAELGQRLQHRLVGIGLHGVADQRVEPGERLGKHGEMARQRRRRIAVERRADRGGDRRQTARPRRAARRRDSRNGSRATCPRNSYWISGSRMNGLSCRPVFRLRRQRLLGLLRHPCAPATGGLVGRVETGLAAAAGNHGQSPPARTSDHQDPASVIEPSIRHSDTQPLLAKFAGAYAPLRANA